MHNSRSRGEKKDPDESPAAAADVGENSSSAARSVETSLGLGFHSTSAAPPPPLPLLRRSLRLSALSLNAQLPPHPNPTPAPAAPSAETPSLEIETNSAPQPEEPHVPPQPQPLPAQPCVRQTLRMSVGGRVPKFSLASHSESKRKRGPPPKGIIIGGNNGDESAARRIPALSKGKEVSKEGQVVDVEEEEVSEGDNVARKCIDKGKGKVIVDEELSDGAERNASRKRRLIENVNSVPVKFKEPINISDSDPEDITEMIKNAVAKLSSLASFNVPRGPPPMGPLHEEAPMHGNVPFRAPISRREAQREKAKELAPEFARFTKDEKEHEGDKDDELLPDGLGPFSVAMKIIEKRAVKLEANEAHSTKVGKPDGIRISWKPSNNGKESFGTKQHRLKYLSVKALAENAEEIETLVGIPCAMRSKLSFMLCQTKKMNMHCLSKLMEGSPTELRLSNCTWATDKDFEDAFGKCDKSNLEVLQLDLCGRCMPDYVLYATLACGPNCLPSLRKLSLKGAYSLSDRGLAAVVSSAPLLNSLNLCECSLLTSDGIMNVIDKRALLVRELYIDECQNIDAMSILPSLKKVKCLEVLSMAGITSVSNQFVQELIPVCGSTLKELNFAGCDKLTSSSFKIIGENCPSLSALDIRNLTLLKDSAIAHLANGCRDIQRLQLRKNSFSDEVIAAFVEASGTKLVELSLNNVAKVGHQTAIAISQQCRFRLQSLDLSFCRKMSDQALGIIVDSCSSLKSLKLFGCSQVTNFFLNGHSNASVNIVGVGGDLLHQIEIPDFV
ncbi:F-box/LRR protein [Rhynchospora pubera]|uniref:F-box/LRR protein n=1 Tax=Rhynchospora pubera TaxID=906938 RepID=A0AAV8FXQ6_9POAL|nr:F-box/LRR protein [Rhynchospora pubera]